MEGASIHLVEAATGFASYANSQGGQRALHSNRRTGCATCRRRRVRCDERREVCGNCARLSLTCLWYQSRGSVQRSRVNTACERCRKKKIKCTSAESTATCTPCLEAKTNCVNTGQRTRSMSPLRATSRSSSHDISTPLPSRAELRRLLKAYIDGPHHFCFYTFIHPPTLMQMFDNDQLPNILLLVIIATSLRFLEPHNSLPDLWADECRRLVILKIFSPPSTTTLQALLLLQRYEWHRASHINAWLLSGLAVRLAHGLQLNLEIPEETHVPVTIREARRRLTWSCFIMESMIEAGRSPLSNLDVSSIEVRVPCDERSFQLGLETSMPDLDHLYTHGSDKPARRLSEVSSQGDPACRPGVSAFLVKLAVLRREILDYTLPYHPRNKGHIPSNLPWAQGSAFFKYETMLEEWQRSLPPELQMGEEVMYRRQSQLISFVTLHCLFHGCYCDLYRIGSYITSSRRMSMSSGSPTDSVDPSLSAFLANCRRGRVQHAFAICEVISQSMKHRSSGHDPVVAIGASLAIRVLVIERQRNEDAALGLSNETVYASLDGAVQCAKKIAQRSVPIRELFCSVCEIAKKHGYFVDLSEIERHVSPLSHVVWKLFEALRTMRWELFTDHGAFRPQSTSTVQQPDSQRAASPSLRTFGTFGSIQSSLAHRKDILAPAASTTDDTESDLFHNFTPPNNKARDPVSSQEVHVQQLGNSLGQSLPHVPVTPTLAGSGPSGELSNWNVDSTATRGYPYLAYDAYSLNDFSAAPAWGDGTLNFSMMPAQIDWINQSLGFDFGNDVLFDQAQNVDFP